MLRLRDIVKVNGRTVCKSDNLAKSDIQSGDVVVVQYRKSHFEGVVDFSREQDTKSKCASRAEGEHESASASPPSGLATGDSVAVKGSGNGTGKGRKRPRP